jgi:hypothetical protein
MGLRVKVEGMHLFSNSLNYAIERIPNLGFISKKKWVKDKIQSLSLNKALIWVKKNFIVWVEVDDEERYWLPHEKALFYQSFFGEKKGSFLIAEQSMHNVFYYGLIDDTLVACTNNLEEAINTIKEYSGKKIKYFGVGEVDLKCHNKIKAYEIAEKIGYEKKENGVFLNEQRDLYEGFNDQEYDLEDLFFHWFDSKKNPLRRINFLKVIFVLGILIFLGLGYSCALKRKEIAEKIDLNLKKIDNINWYES